MASCRGGERDPGGAGIQGCTNLFTVYITSYSYVSFVLVFPPILARYYVHTAGFRSGSLELRIQFALVAKQG